jgi:TonB-linked SusC/RagA family outer membrane protein
MVLIGLFLFATQASAQQKTVTGKVTNEQGTPLSGVAILVKGTTNTTTSNVQGTYSIRADVGQVLQFRLIGNAPEERTVGTEDVINVQLRRTATSLEAVVVTALGETAQQRALGTAQQTVSGTDIAATQRENFVNALQGRIAGVDVTSTSGVPGASSSITIRGVSSISSSNQPLMIIDGLPLDNRTLNTGLLAADAPGSLTAFSNRGVDFTNRAADIDPEDIESITVLKGPEAAALYGIDAANGAIVITTKRGKPGTNGFEYSNSVRMESTRADPEIQRVYGQSTVGGALSYFGAPYAPGTKFYDNIDGFLQTAVTQKHNLAFSGATADNKIGYRLAGGIDKQQGVVPQTGYNRLNLTASSQAQVLSWLKTDGSIQYAYSNNDQTYKGDVGPLIGLLLWPITDDARDYLTPAGTRRRITNLSAISEIDNPYFNINKNKNNSKNNRIIANLGIVVTPFSWGNIKTNLGTDSYTNTNQLVRNPESVLGVNNNGILDLADLITRNNTAQTLFNVNSHTLNKHLSISGLVGNQVSDFKGSTDAAQGMNFLDPNFVSMNNTNTRTSRTTIEQRRIYSGMAQATLDVNNYLYFTAGGRNDWTSTIPQGANSFFYPSFSTSFIFSDAFPSIARYVTGKLRAGYAEVGKDAKPYAYRPSLEFKTTAFGGYGYGFTGPNLQLKPEFAKSYEIGTELSFLDDRLGVDATVYRKTTQDQIVNDIRGSYATGYILFNLNGASTRNQGLELTVRGTPVQSRTLSWDIQANLTNAHGKVLALPRNLPETYVSDTWLYGNVRNGTEPGLSTMSLTGTFFLRNKKGDLLIDPTSGLPIRSTTFIDAGYDRQPKYTVGVTNTFRHKRATLDFLVDIRRGGDVFNATQHYLTTRGLSTKTLDRDVPRVVKGVLRDGKEDTATPTVNTIVITPATQTAYYTNMSEELFIEKNINWLRLRDVQLSYLLPERFLASKSTTVFIKGTDLFLLTNYSGLDPIVNGNSAAVGGSGGTGIDFGNFPMPRGFNFGIRMGY